YGIPYRCLLPLKTTNVLIAGRAASFSAIAASSCRLSRTMMQLGQAAGTAAHLSCSGNIPLREVQASEIRRVMAEHIDQFVQKCE
ncbi:MAG TPA: FAD-dependent oxidoreductase, partial [Kiritimatiellia bacterium]|nr:FAD-dependent oxidoreductase [Kiritimatiellia bacterium]